MKQFLPILLALILTPLAAAQQKGEAVLAHRERKNSAYLVLRLITHQEMELIPTGSLDQCEAIGKEIMKGGNLSKFLKGYKCIPGLL